jgi:hypothetical protein
MPNAIALPTDNGRGGAVAKSAFGNHKSIVATIKGVVGHIDSVRLWPGELL